MDLDTTTAYRASECLGGSWNGPLKASLGRQTTRHAELIRKSFGVTRRSVTTPGVRDKLNDIEGEAPIDKESADRHRANTMRAQYLSSDRPEIQEECGDLARKLQQPSNLDEMDLKRLARFLGVRPRLIWLFKWEKRVRRVEACCDTDHAGCIRTRKSVSGCALMLGYSTVSTYCKGQAVIALRSGEAEYCGLVSAASQTLWLHSILLHWRWKFKVHVWMDVTAGIAIGSRRGLGREKHIDTVFLWVQTMVTEVKISLGKNPHPWGPGTLGSSALGNPHPKSPCVGEERRAGLGQSLPAGSPRVGSRALCRSPRRREGLGRGWLLVPQRVQDQQQEADRFGSVKKSTANSRQKRKREKNEIGPIAASEFVFHPVYPDTDAPLHEERVTAVRGEL